MYKPPQNTNRVKSIKSKFENIENQVPENKHNRQLNGYRNNLNIDSPKRPEKQQKNAPLCSKPPESPTKNDKTQLQRQMSDPCKRNIKRTPAFRVDKSLERTSEFQRNSIDRSTLFETKVKQYSAVKNNCDPMIVSEKCSEKTIVNVLPKKPLLVKSKSSMDFEYIRSKFDDKRSDINNINENKDNNDDKLNNVDLSLLYTEPIPKSLRNNNNNIRQINDRDSTVTNIYNSSTLKVSDKPLLKHNVVAEEYECLTDTLKSALKKPLPQGPAPKKPPRTFEHAHGAIENNNLEKNVSFLHISKLVEKKLATKLAATPSPPKKDPKYMLSKLENAVRNKKLRVRQNHQATKNEVLSTSGEDSDDSLLFRSKTNHHTISSIIAVTTPEQNNRTLPRLPSFNNQNDNNNYNGSSTFNLNCLNGLSCSVSNYEKIKEPNSCFFVGSFEEPVYAEPFHFAKKDSTMLTSLSSSSSLPQQLVLRDMENGGGSTRSKSTTKSARNSLYYMSTPVLSSEPSFTTIDMMNSSSNDLDDIKLPDFRMSDNLRRPSAENSSLSSFTSDLDSTPSPMDDGTTSVQSIQQCFETKSIIDNNTTNNSSTSTTCHGIIINNASTNNRVENLKNCLRSTLEKSFAHDGGSFSGISNINCFIRDSDSENNNNDEKKVMDIIKKFETYRQTMPKYCKPKIHKDTLFYCCLIIDKFKDVARIKYKYPQCVDTPQNLETLCFPENDATQQDITKTAQNYSLLITNDKGERMFGYCRRVLPEGSQTCLPLAYCILSKYRAPRFYKKILEELESRHGIPDKQRDQLICQFYNQKFPKPGNSIKINLNNIEPTTLKTDNYLVDLKNYVCSTDQNNKFNNTSNKLEQNENVDVKCTSNNVNFVFESDSSKCKRELVLTLHPDTRYEDADLKLLHQLPDDVLLKIFSSLLLERKVILISSSIGKLSTCVDSLQSILYPFTWHHTFIPILPQSLWDIVESPTPVICGVLSNEVVDYHQIENGIVVDLDRGVVTKEEKDENKILSKSMQKVWRRNISLANKAAASKEYVHSVFLSDAYLQVFILCFKDYKKYFVNGSFMKEDFLKKKTKGVKEFLKMFTETYMFLAFLDTVATNPEYLMEFDRKIEMYGSEESSVILNKLLDWNK